LLDTLVRWSEFLEAPPADGKALHANGK